VCMDTSILAMHLWQPLITIVLIAPNSITCRLRCFNHGIAHEPLRYEIFKAPGGPNSATFRF
jgi:hypothetical protein